MGFKSKAKAATYVQPDLADGAHSVDELNARNADQQAKSNAACKATWPKENTLTASEIKTLDGSYRVEKASERNEIGQPNSLVSKQPRGYKSGTSSPDVEGESK